MAVESNNIGQRRPRRDELAQFMRRMVDELKQERTARTRKSLPHAPSIDERQKEENKKRISSLLRIGL